MKHLHITLCLLGTLTLAAQNSPYIDRVYEFLPAPGQFVNDLPEFDPSWADYPQKTQQRLVLSAATDYIAGDAQSLVSLGAWGGYITFGFDHMVKNSPDSLDILIMGNAFYAAANPNPCAPREGGSCEPGVVYVSYDANGNGKPDDAWYELAGSEYDSPATKHNYSVTYYRPAADHTPTPNNDYLYLTDTTYIRWCDSEGNTGYVARNSFHAQDYFPMWIASDSITFKGTRLADNAIDESGVGSYYVQYCYPWGYVDNHPNTDRRSKFNIAWAVADDGTPVSLPGAHFFRVQNAMNQYCGWIGETSTEVMGAYDLHALRPDDTDHQHILKQYGGVEFDDFRTRYAVLIDSTECGKDTLPCDTCTLVCDTCELVCDTCINALYDVHSDGGIRLLTNPVYNQIIMTAIQEETVSVHDLYGRLLFSAILHAGTNNLPCTSLPEGIYLLRTRHRTYRFIKR